MITLIPHYKRPEVLELTIAKLPYWAEPIYALSPEDKFLERNQEIIESYGYEYTIIDNEPLNFKMNGLVKFALDIASHRAYFMFLNSDTILNPNYLDFFNIALGRKFGNYNVIGTNTLYITTPNFDKAAKWHYPIDYALGSGRIVRRDLLEKLYPPFPGNQNSGIDGLFAKHCREYGIEHTLVNTCDIPMICDIKTNTNLTQYEDIANKQGAEQLNWNDIKRYFYD